jgi:ppGpp synthetase/RelA/SpoT-type nucleotidyltranferase
MSSTANKGKYILDESIEEADDGGSPSDFDSEVLAAMSWVKPSFPKGRIDWAGEILAQETYSTETWLEDYVEAINIVNNWRAVHSYPLQAMKMTLKSRAKHVCPTTVVAQRLKRLSSIELKLTLSKNAGHHPQLSQMQDIGGCRAIMESVSQVFRVKLAFLEASRKSPHRGPQCSKIYDYIANPKSTGYRSVHLVYRFRSDSPEHSCYNGQRIEIQLRSRLQHSWATAVETYSTFSGEALKSNVGSEQWKRFFALASSVIAIREKQPTVAGTPRNEQELLQELRALYVELNVHKVLSGWATATKYTEKGQEMIALKDEDKAALKNAALYLLVLDPETFQTTIHPYPKNAAMIADAQYALIERDHPKLQAVLVSVDSLSALRTAYPNYFLDTSVFLNTIAKAVNDENRSS